MQVSDSDRHHLNRALANSDDRVRQFNDLRLLAGLIHEHGRCMIAPAATETENRIKQPRRQSAFRWPSPRMSKAALVLMGMLLGCLATGAVLAFSSSTMSSSVEIPLEISNGGFETKPTEPTFGYPIVPQIWTGDRADIVQSGDQEIVSYEGQRMLRFNQTWGDTPGPVNHRANRWQIIDLSRIDLGGNSAVATLRARFNRIDAGPETDTHCRVELHAFEGAPADAEARWDAKEFLSGSIRRGRIDADTKTWETMEVSATVPASADYLLIGLSVFEDAMNDPPDQIEFAGHYVDGVELTLLKSPMELTGK